MIKTYPVVGLLGRNVMAVATGEFRPPRRGEWFLSGAIVEAYEAFDGLTMDYHIARLVRVKRTVVETITIEDDYDG